MCARRISASARRGVRALCGLPRARRSCAASSSNCCFAASATSCCLRDGTCAGNCCRGEVGAGWFMRGFMHQLRFESRKASRKSEMEQELVGRLYSFQISLACPSVQLMPYRRQRTGSNRQSTLCVSVIAVPSVAVWRSALETSISKFSSDADEAMTFLMSSCASICAVKCPLSCCTSSGTTFLRAACAAARSPSMVCSCARGLKAWSTWPTVSAPSSASPASPLASSAPRACASVITMPILMQIMLNAVHDIVARAPSPGTPSKRIITRVGSPVSRSLRSSSRIILAVLQRANWGSTSCWYILSFTPERLASSCA
mmetsp:Transcript_32857/g.81654  ORF Transcript_32857/g.81654 Transcript_32857/m.81654 type:complete len:316 (-) Transcript_32857:62-1009(-)